MIIKKIKMSKKNLLIASAVVLIVIVGVVILKSRNKIGYDFVMAQKGTLIQEVNVSGRLKPRQGLDMGFETSGRVSRVLKRIGDQVFANEKIIELDASQLYSQLNQAEAGLAAEQSRFNELQSGTKPEELLAARTLASGLEKSLAEVKANRKAIQDKAVADLDNTYSSALASLQKSVSYAKSSLYTLTDIQYNHFYSNNTVADAKARAVLYLLGAADAGRWTNSSISSLSGGAFGQVQKAIASQVQADIDQALAETSFALQQVKTALDSLPVSDQLTSTEKANLSSEKTNVLAEISTVSSKEQTILVQKSTNIYNLAVAEASVTSAQNSYNSALDQLAIKEAGATQNQLLIQQSLVDAAFAAVQNIKSQLAKTMIFSPINGIVTKLEVEVGESVSPNMVVLSIMSASEFEIESRVAEVDIAKIKIGDSANVTLDAYGSDVVFKAKVVKVDPAETIIEGLSTYKVTLQFVDKDDRLRSGMTADIDILTAEKQEVILIPQRAVFTENGDKFVRILKKGNEVEAIKVKTGLRGSNGEIEIIEGLNEGDKVVTSIKEN
ncbi:efflux RND transporter periplasmic adaptor subunit [Patescibacteria group bacterium]|nr:efflux RND transporter periplasmic adaptor subunit [Patescibacteria group bacterium]MBU4466980.1 efflux RND transporter periplasmic adaptor subunit [Patescibacteria group bacterium]